MLVTVIVALLLMYFDDLNVFSTIYLDIFLPVLYAYGIYLIVAKETENSKFGYFSLLVTQSSLVITKQMGVAYILLIWFFYTLSLVHKDSFKVINIKIVIHNIFSSLLVLILPFANYLIWGNYIKTKNISGQFDLSKIDISNLIQIIFNGGSEVQSITYHNYIGALFKTPLTQHFFKLTFFLQR